MSAVLTVRGLRCRYGRGQAAPVDGVDFEVAEGERLALVGPSGCGKTTTLRAIAGLEPLEAGEISLRGRLLAGPSVSLPPEARGVGLVFQELALFPHLTALQNVAFGLEHLPKAGREARARQLLVVASLGGLEDRRPGELSGGQQQRVALARALAPAPALLLLDEPFSSLDASLREELRAEVRGLLARLGMSAVLVTHDREEVFAFADRVAVMNAGRIEQVGTPEALYAAPRTAFVAGLLGECALLPATARGDVADSALGQVPLAAAAQGEVLLVVRPESLQIREGGPGVVRSRRFRGPFTQLEVELGGLRVPARVPGISQLREGDGVSVAPQGPLCAVPAGPRS